MSGWRTCFGGSRLDQDLSFMSARSGFPFAVRPKCPSPVPLLPHRGVRTRPTSL